MIFRTKPSRAPRGAIRPAPTPNLRSAFAQRRAIFGPHELREDRIRAEDYLALDLSAEARRAIREGECA